MISLILASLFATPSLMFAPINGAQVNNTGYLNVVSYDNKVLRYEYNDDTDGSLEGAYSLQQDGNNLDFSITANTGTYVNGSDNYYYVQFQFSSLDVYKSNIYLSHISCHLYVGDTDKVIYLPNVYFLNRFANYNSTTERYYYMDSYDEGVKYYTEFPYTGNVSSIEAYWSFDFELLPEDLVNDSSYDSGYTDGWNAGNDNGFNDGYDSGYTAGYQDAETNLDVNGSTATIIFAGIIDVALLPINFFLACLNFEVFGINIGAMVTATLTIAILVILFRTIFAGGNGGGDK